VTTQPFVRAWFGKLRPDDRVALHGAGVTTWTPADTLRSVEGVWRQPGAAFDLTRTLQTAKPEGAPLVLVTDGLVADDNAAILAAKKLGVPIHVIGVGAAPARGLLVRIAGITGGTVRFVLPVDDLALVASQLAADLAAQPAPLAVNWGTLSVTEVVPASLPRLGAGQATIVVAKVRRTHAASPTANIRVRGELFAIETLSPRKPLDGALTAAGPLARRWAKLRLDDLLVGNENVAAVTAHSMTYGLVSPYTTLVAIGTDVVIEGGVKHSVAVPVSVPAGMHWVDVKQETTVTTADKGEVDANVARDTTKTVATHDKPEPSKTKPPTEKKPAARPSAPSGGVHRPESVDRLEEEEGEADEPRKKKRWIDDEDDEAGDSDGTVDVASSAPAPADAEVLYGAVAGAEVMEAHGGRRGFRLSLFGGGGLSIQGTEQSPLFAIGLRFELGRARNLAGLEGTLFGVGTDDGLDAQGRFLLTYTRLGVLAPFVELGAGLGAHTGVGSGFAWSLSMRARITPRVGGYLRYDGARLRLEAIEVQTTTTIGVEAAF
jgi:hypothetical protein